MGKHRGFRVTANPNGTWKAWPWDPHGQRYAKIRSGFRTQSEAKAYAQDESAKFRARLQFTAKATTRNLAEEYQTYLRDIKVRSSSHLRNVRRALAVLVRACPDPSHPRAATAVEEALAKLDVSARTKVQFLVTIKAMGNWAVERKRLGQNPWTVAQTKDPGSPLKEQFTLEELRRMVVAIDDGFWFDAVTFVYTGMRASEPATTLRERINPWEDEWLSVVGKGRGERRKERLVPIQDEYRPLLALELGRRQTGPLATRSYHQYHKHFPDFLRRLGLMKHQRTLHSWRHTYAGLMSASGEPSSNLQGYLGHSSSATTAHYSALAHRFRQGARAWERGQFQLLRGVTSPIPRQPADASA